MREQSIQNTIYIILAGRPSGLQKDLSDEVLAWLSVWSEVQMICIWSNSCHCHPIISCFIKIQIGLTLLVPAYPGCPEKRPLNGCLFVCLCIYMLDHKYIFHAHICLHGYNLSDNRYRPPVFY